MSNPGELWAHATVVISMLSDSAALEATALGSAGLADPRGRGGLWIEMSTVSAEASACVAQAAGAAGIDLAFGQVCDQRMELGLANEAAGFVAA